MGASTINGLLKKNIFNKYRKLVYDLFDSLTSCMIGNINYKIDYAKYNRIILKDSDILSVNKQFQIYIDLIKYSINLLKYLFMLKK